MDIDDDDVREVLHRLHRVQGQVGAIARMIEEGRGCREVARQLAAAERALERASARYLVANLTACLRDEPAAEAEGYSVEQIERLLVDLA
jgi:DNA-binding FrmR family transcriptional regulator